MALEWSISTDRRRSTYRGFRAGVLVCFRSLRHLETRARIKQMATTPCNHQLPSADTVRKIEYSDSQIHEENEHNRHGSFAQFCRLR
jgi:hypothetical protein